MLCKLNLWDYTIFGEYYILLLKIVLNLNIPKILAKSFLGNYLLNVWRIFAYVFSYGAYVDVVCLEMICFHLFHDVIFYTLV